MYILSYKPEGAHRESLFLFLKNKNNKVGGGVERWIDW